MEDLCPFTYEQCRKSTVYTLAQDITFERISKLYVADFFKWINPKYEENLSLLTVVERENLLTRKEFRKAKHAK